MQPVLQICRGAGYVQPNTPEAFQATNDQEVDASEIIASVTRRVDTVSLDEGDMVPWRTVLSSLTATLLTQLARPETAADAVARSSGAVPCVGASDATVASCFPPLTAPPNPRQLTPNIPVEVTLVQRHAAPVQKMHHIHKSDGHETFEWKDADGAACGVFQPTVVARRRVRGSDSDSDGESDEESAEDEDAAARNKLFYRVHELSTEEQGAYAALRRLWAERVIENKRSKAADVSQTR
jgi:hypothetical protein